MTLFDVRRWFMVFAIVLLAAAALNGCAHDGKRVSDRIEEAEFVSIGGIPQWITIRGDHRENPILLFVHGGPGDPQSLLVGTYAPYERDFVVVQWDQRGAGKTFLKNREAVKELTLEQMAQDGVELADHLRTRLRQKKVIVLGHSWGTTLATAMAQRRPELFSAYVGTGQVSSWPVSVNAQWEYLQSAAQAARDQATLDRMKSIGTPDPYNVMQYFSWRNIMNRNYLNTADATWLQGLRALANNSGLSPEEQKALGEGGNFSATQLMKVMMTTDLGKTAVQMPVPFYVIQGRDDLYTPTAPAIEYFNSVKAPRKELVVIEAAGHFAIATHSEAFLKGLADIGLVSGRRRF
jgi:proline iminopeptidase